MSWSGFKKNVGRATTQVMMKTGQVEKTTDREYEVEERRYRTLESASLRLQKEAKGYLDSLRAMTASQMRIAETIDAFYGDSGARDGVSRSYKQAVEDLDAETVKALDGPYRTTVLEPINRFCAYFPDINECIKKRNHKMLDYDALRSKVKKLTEKPDKDPGKLPRTEKEMEMVSLQHFLANTPTTPPPRSSTEQHDYFDFDEGDVDLTMPSPPKILQAPSIQHRIKDSELDRSTYPVPTFKSTQTARETPADQSSRDSSRTLSNRYVPRSPSGYSETTVIPSYTRSQCAAMFPRFPIHGSEHLPTATAAMSEAGAAGIRNWRDQHLRAQPQPIRIPTPFFQPSELEDIMQPLKQEYRQKQADKVSQARATYEQLNEQLTSELPQLIDLRVPYLDPSFEALVKIQLRFCAEAYSRMAQVQQYLDASTRDQYASGDLDARVEDVLGQIRELSIAGTV